jgi:hypothetical protein
MRIYANEIQEEIVEMSCDRDRLRSSSRIKSLKSSSPFQTKKQRTKKGLLNRELV